MMLLAVFRARAHSLAYADRLNEYGVTATTVNTPKEAKIGCGLCVRFDARHFYRARAILRTGNYTSFKGFYQIDFICGRMTVTPFVPKP